MTYIVQSDIENRITAAVVRQILDDDLSGTADANNVTRVISDAEGYVESFLRGNYDLAAIRALGVSVPNEIKRLCLDVAVAYLWDRHPEYVRADGDKLMARAHAELVELRHGDRRLDVVGSPEPAANQQHFLASGDPDDPTPADTYFLRPGDMGDF